MGQEGDTHLPEVLAVEYLQRELVRDFDDGVRVESVDVVAVAGLDEDGRVGLALGEEETLPRHVGQLHSWRRLSLTEGGG